MAGMNLADKVIWITGASSGIGRALAVALAKKGSRLILTARRTTLLEELQRELGSERVGILSGDLGNSSDLQQLSTRAIEMFGRVDILINNAGVSQRSTAAETGEAVIRRILDVDFFAPVVLSRNLLTSMRTLPESSIVVVTSIVGKFGTQLRSAYSAAKHALHGYFEALRLEEWKHNVQITLVVAGFVRTEVSESALSGDGSAHGAMDPSQAAGIGPEEAATTIVRALERRRNEVYVGLDARTRLALFLNAVWPSLLYRILRNSRVT
ncbi:MAG TPA: SDR family oxidoreductase [Spirochaetia bacterium]|nr:SDR family oxidoreductase [Spirochaetia bacterium]